jgi:ketosteroid isomerase-like protein
VTKAWVAVCVLAASAVMMTGCKGAAHDNAADVQSLKDNETQWNADFASKDAAKIAAHYADDASLILAGEKPTVGKAAITAAFTGMVSDPAFSLVLHTDKAEVSGDVGFTQGSYVLTLTNPMDKSVLHDTGSYVTGYRKDASGAWKAVSDAPVSDVPQPAPATK